MQSTFGQFQNLRTPIHRLDPRLKFIGFIVLVTFIFMNFGIVGYAFKFAVVFIIALIAKLPVRKFWTTIRSLLFLLITLFILQWLSIKTGKSLAGPDGAIYSIHEGMLWSYMNIVVRIYLMIMMTNIFMFTTSPLDLTMALEDLFLPLKYIKFPVHIFAMIMSIALRSIPTLMEESERILKAQASRGVDFKNGGFKEKVKSITSLIIPLFVIAIVRAGDLSNAMEVRGYDPYAKRTRYRNSVLTNADYLKMFIIFSFAGLFITLNVLGVYIHIAPDEFMKR